MRGGGIFGMVCGGGCGAWWYDVVGSVEAGVCGAVDVVLCGLVPRWECECGVRVCAVRDVCSVGVRWVVVYEACVGDWRCAVPAVRRGGGVVGVVGLYIESGYRGGGGGEGCRSDAVS